MILAGPLLAASLMLAGQAVTVTNDLPFYSAMSDQDPAWMVSVSEREVSLRLYRAGGLATRDFETRRFPGTQPHVVDGLRIWESANGPDRISIEARPGPCGRADDHRYADQVRIRFNGRDFTGCGGRILHGEPS